MLLLPTSSMAVGDFVATMALASRIYRPFDSAFADRTLTAAKKSYAWLETHPEFLFEHIKECGTGGYGDRSDIDERLWAAMELYRTTGEAHYLTVAKKYFDSHPNPIQYGWGDISGFAGWALLENELMPKSIAKEDDSSAEEATFCSIYKELLLKEADRLLSVIDTSPRRADRRFADALGR